MSHVRHDFKTVYHIGNTTLMDELESNLKTWLDWGFLRIGAWFDVEYPTEGGYGGDFSILRRVDDPAFTAGTVWESARKDWVWEIDVDYVGLDTNTHNPKVVANTVLVNTTPTAYSWIDYPLGRVHFSSPISLTAVVAADYSYRWVQVYKATTSQWWKELQYRSFRVDDAFFSQLDGGSWSIGGQHRIQMPTVVIEAVPRSTSRPYQLGDGSAWVNQDIICHVLAETASDRNKIVDILRGQFDSSLILFNSNSISTAEDWPLDYKGMIVDSGQTYPMLVDDHPWTQCRISRTEISEVDALNSRLYEGRVRLTCEVVLND